MNHQTVIATKTKVKFFEGEKWLVLAGLLGLLLAGVCLVRVMLYGGHVAPEGDVSKAFSFNAALGMFLLSTAAILPFSTMGAKSKAFFRWFYIILALYSYFAETVQHFRGVDPRYVTYATPFNVAVSSIFIIVAMLLVVVYVFLAVSYFRRKTCLLHPELVLGIRYAMIATMISFSAGIWISFNGGTSVGMHGNIIWLHGIGFHALQVMPIVAWMTQHSSLSARSRRTRIHIAGIAYLLGLIAVGWQTYLGNPVVQWSAVSLLGFSCFFISFVTGALVLRTTVKDPKLAG